MNRRDIDIEVYGRRPPFAWYAYEWFGDGCEVVAERRNIRTRFGLRLSLWAFTLRKRWLP